MIFGSIAFVHTPDEKTTRVSKWPKHVVAKSEDGQRKGQNAWVRRLKWKRINYFLESEYSGLDVPIMRTPGAPCRSTREKNVVAWFSYNDYIAYHYAFMMKVVTIQEPETFSEAAKDPRWVEAMNEEMHTLSKNETWDLKWKSVVPSTLHTLVNMKLNT